MSKASKSSASEHLQLEGYEGHFEDFGPYTSASRPIQPTPSSRRFSSACPMTGVSAHTWAT
jgi:hypothetical protein